MPEIDVASLKKELAVFLKDRDEGLVGALRARLDAIEQIVGEGQVRHAPAGAASAFKGLLENSRLADYRAGAMSTGRIELAGLRLKTVVTGSPGDSPGDGTVPTRPDRGVLVAQPMRPLTLLDALPVIPVSSSVYEYVPLEIGEAGIQENEGAEKTAAAVGASLETAPIVTVAVHQTFSNQVLSDNVALGEAVRRIFTYRVRAKLERMIVTGQGVAGTDPIRGIQAFGTALVVSETEPADRVAEGVSLLDEAGYVPRVVAMSPRTWNRIRVERAVGGSGTYLGGSWASPAAAQLWGLPVVTVPSMDLGTVAIVDPNACAVLDREIPSVAVSREHGENFTKNLSTVLCEMRAGFVLLDAGGVGVIEDVFVT